jgi:hypothetical protein
MIVAVELEQTAYFDFITSNPSTGSVSDADSTPTAAVFEDANDTAILSPTVTKRTSLTGNYRVPIAATTANLFRLNHWYNVVVTATVNGITSKAVVASFVMTSAVPLAAVVTNGSNTSSTFQTDRAESTTDYWKNTLLVFLTGTLAGQVQKVSAYNGSTFFITVLNAFTGAPASGDKFALINR